MQPQGRERSGSDKLCQARERGSHSARVDVDLAPPALLVRLALSGPVKRRPLDLGKGPAHQAAAWIGTFLDDIAVAGATDLLREEAGYRVVPKDTPGIEIGIVDAQRRSVPVSRARQLTD